jgi:hypothetical protein
MLRKTLATIALLGALIFVPAAPTEAAINVLRLGAHDPSPGNIHGDFSFTFVSNLTGVNFANFDVIYIDEHVGVSSFSGREVDVRNAMLAGNLGLAAEVGTIANANSSMRTILGSLTVSEVFSSGTATLTPSGAAHPIFTGSGISGGGPVNIAGFAGQSVSAYSGLDASWTVLATNGALPRTVVGTVGLSNFVLMGYEPGEFGGSMPANERMFVHNSIHFAEASSSAVPEPGTLTIFGLGALGLGLANFRRRKMAH